MQKGKWNIIYEQADMLVAVKPEHTSYGPGSVGSDSIRTHNMPPNLNKEIVLGILEAAKVLGWVKP